MGCFFLIGSDKYLCELDLNFCLLELAQPAQFWQDQGKRWESLLLVVMRCEARESVSMVLKDHCMNGIIALGNA